MPRFVLTPALFDPCLHVYPMKAWEEFEQKVSKLPSLDPNAVRFRRMYVSAAVECELDKAGRVLVPPHLRERAELDKSEALWAGMGRNLGALVACSLGRSARHGAERNGQLQARRGAVQSMTMAAIDFEAEPVFTHVSVMPGEVVEAFDPARGGVFVDATAGGAGHSAALLAASPEPALDRLRSRSAGGAHGAGAARSIRRARAVRARFLRSDPGALGGPGNHADRRHFGRFRAELAAARGRRSRHELSLQRSARHAHGSDARRDRARADRTARAKTSWPT